MPELGKQKNTKSKSDNLLNGYKLTHNRLVSIPGKYKIGLVPVFTWTTRCRFFCEGLSHRVLHFLNRIIDCCCVAECANILLSQNLVEGGTALPSMTFHRLSKLNPVSLYCRGKYHSFLGQ